MPSVILGIQKEVGAHDGDTNSNDNQNKENQEHEAINVIDLVRPK